MAELADKLSRLRAAVQALDGGVAVAFSGGVDSALLLKVCAEELHGRVLAVTADSPSLPARDRADAIALARQFGVAHRFVATAELDDERYARNDTQRCYHCKRTLFETVAPLAEGLGLPHLAFGANADDAGDYRPGHRAAREYRVVAPLLDAGLTKAEVRELARLLDVPVWDKPASACLASRIPYGTPVDAATLEKVEAAERALHALGFEVCRVRHHGDVARVELPGECIAEAAGALRERVEQAVREAGYLYVAVDLRGYRSGSLNEGLRKTEDSPRS